MNTFGSTPLRIGARGAARGGGAAAVEAATGVRPELPDRLADLHARPESLTRMPNDLVVVQQFVEAHRRVR